MTAKKPSKFRAAIIEAFADYRKSEGCECCRDGGAHKEAENRLGNLLGVPRYSDDSGWDWEAARSEGGASDA